MFNQIIAIIISFFVSLFGSSSAESVETPDVQLNPETQQGTEIEEISVGDAIDVHVSGNVEAAAKILQTNGNKFTVELTVTGNPHETIFVSIGDALYNLKTDANGIAYTTFLTMSLELSVSTL